MTQIYTKLSFTKLIFLVLLFTSIQLNSQTMIGLNHSNLSGIHQINFNPANIADARHRIYINAFTLNTGFNNDYLKLSLPFSIFNIMNPNQIPSQYKNSAGQINFDEAWLQEDLNGKSKNFNLYAQLRTPGVMLKITKGITVGFQVKNNVSFQINDVHESLARTLRHGVDSSNGSIVYSGTNQFSVGQTFGDNSFSINVNAWGEIAGTIAASVINTEKFSLKVGATPKYLMGYATGYIRNKGIILKVPSVDTLTFNRTDVSYGYTNPKDFENFDANQFFKRKLQGGGIGYDLGVSFEYNPEIAEALTSKKNKYLFRGGISLLDAGSIKYNNPARNVTITNGNVDKHLLLDSNFTNAFSKGEASGIRYLDSTMKTLFNFDSSNQVIKTAMPTTLNFQFDYNVLKNFYIGANWSQDLRGKKVIGIRKPSYITVIPRFESKLIEVSLPIGLMNDYKTGRIGAFLRVGPVYIGTDNLIGQIRSKNYYGADFYFGASFGIPSKKKD